MSKIQLITIREVKKARGSPNVGAGREESAKGILHTYFVPNLTC